MLWILSLSWILNDLISCLSEITIIIIIWIKIWSLIRMFYQQRNFDLLTTLISGMRVLIPWIVYLALSETYEGVAWVRLFLFCFSLYFQRGVMDQNPLLHFLEYSLFIISIIILLYCCFQKMVASNSEAEVPQRSSIRKVLGLGYWVQGFRCFPWMAINFFLKDALHVHPSTLQLLLNSSNLPMVAKPLYGILSDSVYLADQHRIPYIAIGGMWLSFFSTFLAFYGHLSHSTILLPLLWFAFSYKF